MSYCQQCVIVAAGYCAGIEKYNAALDYRRSGSSNGSLAIAGPNFFPSANMTYCPMSDATCAQCRETAFKDSTDGITNPSQFCIGLEGCVCVGFCESTVWKPVMVDMTCQKTTGSSSTTDSSQVRLTGPLRTVAFIVVLCITLPVVIIVGLSTRVRWTRERARRRLRQARLDARAPQLVLTGWKALREELIENEHQSHAGQMLIVGFPVSLSGGLEPPSLSLDSRENSREDGEQQDQGAEIEDQEAERRSTA